MFKPVNNIEIDNVIVHNSASQTFQTIVLTYITIASPPQYYIAQSNSNISHTADQSPSNASRQPPSRKFSTAELSDSRQIHSRSFSLLHHSPTVVIHDPITFTATSRFCAVEKKIVIQEFKNECIMAKSDQLSARGRSTSILTMTGQICATKSQHDRRGFKKERIIAMHVRKSHLLIM